MSQVTNRRVIIWAEANGVPLDRLDKKPEEELYDVNGVPWTVEYSNWIMHKWALFRIECHGTTVPGECCAPMSAKTHERFDKWLETEYEV